MHAFSHAFSHPSFFRQIRHTVFSEYYQSILRLTCLSYNPELDLDNSLDESISASRPDY